MVLPTEPAHRVLHHMPAPFLILLFIVLTIWAYSPSAKQVEKEKLGKCGLEIPQDWRPKYCFNSRGRPIFRADQQD